MIGWGGGVVMLEDMEPVCVEKDETNNDNNSTA